MQALTTVGMAAVVFLIVLSLLLKAGRRGKNYPPGPATLPILGNIHQVPRANMHKQFQKWAQQYGPIISIMVGTRPMVILSTDTAVKDVLDRQSAKTTDRGAHFIAHNLLSGGERMLLMDNNEKFRLQRRLMQKMLNVTATKAYEPYIILEQKAMLHDILEKPDAFFWHLKRYSYAIASSLTYGTRTARSDDPSMVRFLHGTDLVNQILQDPLSGLVDAFPILRYLPSAMLPIARQAKSWHREESKYYVDLFQATRDRLNAGTAKPCFTVDLIKAQEKENFTDKFGAYMAGGAMEAGTDSSSNTMYGFIQAMVLFPEVQRKAQEELDQVIGNRIPTTSDWQNLPYIRACVKESLRWMPTAITGAAPHAAGEDLQYMGYTIPKGALLINNVYSIHFDPERHPDPRAFNPDRYLHDDMTSAESAHQNDASKRDHFTFGAGRRLCAGIHIADHSLFTGIAGILWAFDIKPEMDKATSKPILPNPELYTPDVLCRPQSFRACITPRSNEKSQLVRESWCAAKTVLDNDGQWQEIPEGMKFSEV